MTEIKIPLSKQKNLLALAGAILFVIAGVWFVSSPETFISPIHRSKATLIYIGIAAILFFGFCAVYLMIRLSDKSYGLIICKNGITDNTNASSIGLIDWEDISSITTEQISATRFLLVFVTHPDKYLNRATGLKRKLMQANNRMYGTPISIVATSLKCDFDELESAITSGLNEFRKVTL